MMEELDEVFLKKDPLGEILVQRGLLKPPQLAAALMAQQERRKLIGEILVEQGVLQEIDIVVALVIQCSLPYLAVDKYPVDRSVLALVPQEKARLWHVIPLDKVGDVLSVVMANPLNKAIRQGLIQLTGCKLAPFIATKTEIDAAIQRCYQ